MIKKASDKELIEEYGKNKSIWKTAEKFGMCGQTVWERLKKLGIKLNNPKFSDEEEKILRKEYKDFRKEGNLKVLAERLNRTRFSICRKAKELGLTNPYNKGRKRSPTEKRLMRQRMLGRFAKEKHPKRYAQSLKYKKEMMKYRKRENGEGLRINLDENELREACCSCGMVHRWQFHHIKKNIWDFAFFVDRRATAQLRRHNYGSLQQNRKDEKYRLVRKKEE